jgi:diketogulonate reductase-like aldo/keto reductase
MRFSRSKRIKNVLSLQVARKRARQPRGGSNRHVSKREIIYLTKVIPSKLSNQRLLERLKAENAQLRASVVDLMLQIQALRDGAR